MKENCSLLFSVNTPYDVPWHGVQFPWVLFSEFLKIFAGISRGFVFRRVQEVLFSVVSRGFVFRFQEVLFSAEFQVPNSMVSEFP